MASTRVQSPSIPTSLHSRPAAARGPQLRGVCPGLSVPIATGDGLLARFLPVGTIPLAAFSTLCAAARACGNGIIEVTARGSIQVRGLRSTSAPRFAGDITALGIAAADGISVHCNALAGLDAGEVLDGGALAMRLRNALARASFATWLAPKLSVAIDGGGSLKLDALSADLRLCAEATGRGAVLRVGIGGDSASAVQIGIVAASDAVEAAMRVLQLIARRGRHLRARDILAAEGVLPFSATLSDLLTRSARVRRYREREPNQPRTATLPSPCKDAVGLHQLRGGRLACGVGLAFGHADASSLERLTEAAQTAGANGVRATPGRALIAIGLTCEAAPAFAAAAEQLGFIARADDPRRHVVACAGAPICACAWIAARAVAPMIAQTIAPHRGGACTIHVSGCSKGCAHPAPATLTAVGIAEGCALVANGSARDSAFAVVPMSELPSTVARFARAAQCGGGHG